MPTPIETLRQAARTWAKTYAHPAGTALTNAQVILADEAAPRPPMPYLVVDVISLGGTEGHDETRASLATGGVPQHKAHGRRTATVSVQGYGEATAEWLEELRLSCALADDVADTLAAAGYPRLGFFSSDAVRDVSQLLDTASEPRYSLDVSCHYAVSSRARAQVELETVVATVTHDSDASTPLVNVITATV